MKHPSKLKAKDPSKESDASRKVLKSTRSKKFADHILKLSKFDPMQIAEMLDSEQGAAIVYGDFPMPEFKRQIKLKKFSALKPAAPGTPQPSMDPMYRAFLNGDQDAVNRPPSKDTDMHKLDGVLQDVRDLVTLISKKKNGRRQKLEKNLTKLELLFNNIQQIALGLDD